MLRTLDADHAGISIGAVFANAGVIFNNTIMNSSIEDWETTLRQRYGCGKDDQNVSAPVTGANKGLSFLQHCIGWRLSKGDGGAASYQASKHAVVALSESLSFEIARKSPQIRVHVLCPCIVTSSLLQSSQKIKHFKRIKLKKLRYLRLGRKRRS